MELFVSLEEEEQTYFEPEYWADTSLEAMTIQIVPVRDDGDIGENGYGQDGDNDGVSG